MVTISPVRPVPTIVARRIDGGHTAEVEPLERLLADRDLTRLLVEYCALVDFGQAERIADLFTAEGVWESSDGVRMEGQDAIRAGFGRRQGISRRSARHVITNLALDVDSPQAARGRCYLINYRHDSAGGVAEVPAPVDHPKFVGEYHDRFVHTADGWRFAHRRFDLGFVRPPSRGN
jgi:hypothetical protein